jgi:putative two-component system response regulator
VPTRALGLSLGALGLPVLVWLVWPQVATHETGLLVWLTCLVPAFLLTYHRGWRGASVALAAGLAVLALVHAVLALRGAPMPDWRFVAALVGVYLAVALGVGALADLLRRQEAAAHSAALRDPLTGLPNRRHAQIVLDASFSGARAGHPLSLILFDLDRFRWINEEHGHHAGDEVLVETAGLLRRSLHDGETVGRWGGGEFLVILPGTPLEEAVARAEALGVAVRDAPLRWRPVTVSGGVATLGPHHATADSLVNAVDEALRQAKAEGGDRVAARRFVGEAEAALAIREARGSIEGAPTGYEARGPSLHDDAPLFEARIVVVDDEASNLRAFRRGLEALGFQHVATFEDPGEAVRAIEDDPPDLVLLDLMMPVMDGFEVLDHLRPLLEREGFLPVVILTGERDPEVRDRALRLGGKDFLNKPVDLTELEVRILNLLETRALHRALRDARDRLEERVLERTRELESARVEILRRLARAAEYRDDATGRHQERVGLLAERLAVRMRVDSDTVELLRLAAPLHDLGKIAIPDDILRKPGPLTDDQFDRMREHTKLGAEMLSGSSHPILEVARVIALSHHERWDGRGYPLGRRGAEIPLVGRIVSVADVFDSLLHKRPYKEALPKERVLAMIRKDSGTAFDPDVVQALDELAERGMLEDLVAD